MHIDMHQATRASRVALGIAGLLLVVACHNRDLAQDSTATIEMELIFTDPSVVAKFTMQITDEGTGVKVVDETRTVGPASFIRAFSIPGGRCYTGSGTFTDDADNPLGESWEARFCPAAGERLRFRFVPNIRSPLSGRANIEGSFSARSYAMIDGISHPSSVSPGDSQDFAFTSEGLPGQTLNNSWLVPTFVSVLIPSYDASAEGPTVPSETMQMSAPASPYTAMALATDNGAPEVGGCAVINCNPTSIATTMNNTLVPANTCVGQAGGDCLVRIKADTDSDGRDDVLVTETNEAISVFIDEDGNGSFDTNEEHLFVTTDARLVDYGVAGGTFEATVQVGGGTSQVKITASSNGAGGFNVTEESMTVGTP